jgi:uncharacterized protein YgbK (DUF1537 family)
MMPQGAARPWMTWYGDDFTGSTDALDALARHGVRAVLFLEKPDAELLRRFEGVQALGLAGISRSRSPQWMLEHLPALFAWLRDTGAPLCHYKVCSTFDSSPTTGSIGRALEIGRAAFEAELVPIVVGAPALGRYTVFGNLFAGSGGAIYRIDRHPAMARHPVTPMDEADLREHLARQTSLAIGLVNLIDMKAGRAIERLEEERASGVAAALLDVFDDATLLEAGRALWPTESAPAGFVVGSSGVEAALIARWRELGMLPETFNRPQAQARDRIVVLSGSCSPATARQIRWAMRCGYAAFHVDPRRLLSSGGEAEVFTAGAAEALSAGKSVVLFTALEGEAGLVEGMPGGEAARFNEELGVRCGRLLAALIARSGVRRVVVAGGDTSSHAGRQLGLRALTFQAALAVGAPLCAASSGDPALDGLEVVFKGGQIGGEDFFEFARSGRGQQPVTGYQAGRAAPRSPSSG